MKRDYWGAVSDVGHLACSRESRFTKSIAKCSQLDHTSSNQHLQVISNHGNNTTSLTVTATLCFKKV